MSSTSIIRRSDLKALGVSRRTTVREIPASHEHKGWQTLLGSAGVMAAIVGVGLAAQSLTKPRPVVMPRPAFMEFSTQTPSPANAALPFKVSLPTAALQPATPIYSRIGGVVSAVTVSQGERVRVGQVLAVITSPGYDRELQRAEADLRQGRAEAESAWKNLSQAREDLQDAERKAWHAEITQALAQQDESRYQKLAELSASLRDNYNNAIRTNASARVELLAAQTDMSTQRTVLDTRQTEAREMRARLNRLHTRWEELQHLQSFKTITAPFDGTIANRHVNTGAAINSGEPLFDIVQISEAHPAGK